ncbi:MAG: ImmA/IrrE family metallo-endopeptidase [Saccharofermentanales bacterium]|jgi:transcriptional regulator with XRE-family HTH domain
MTRNASFNELISKLYDDEIMTALSHYLEDSPLHAELDFYDDVEQVELYDYRIKFYSIENLPGAAVKFDLVLEAELLISSEANRYDEETMFEQWFTLSCTAAILDGFHDFHIHSIEVYTGKRKQNNPLSDSLVPIFWKEELDDRAEEFLSEFYPEALEQPLALDIPTITEKLGLTVRGESLSADCTIFGMTVFSDCHVRIYDHENDNYITVPASKGTIFYDPDVFFMRTLGSVRNTIIHECVHWHYHAKAMELERLFNRKATDIRCQVTAIPKSKLHTEKNRNPRDWMEWHANALAPRILMPKNMFQKKADSILDTLQLQYPAFRRVDMVEMAIQELAEFFQVSKLAVKIRLLDLGYDEARGVLNYQNDNYIPNYSFKKGSILHNQTFFITPVDLAYIFFSDKFGDGRFRKLYEAGQLKYVDHCICLNDPLYIKTLPQGRFGLTDYAWDHMDECCVKFEATFKRTAIIGTDKVDAFTLLRRAVEALIPQIEYHAVSNNQVLDRAEALELISMQAQEISGFVQGLTNSFPVSLAAVMKRYEMTNEKLAELADCSDKTIQRYRTGEEKPTQKTLIEICVGMHLPFPITAELLRQGGCPLGNSQEDTLTETLLRNGNYADIFDWREQHQSALNCLPEK